MKTCLLCAEPAYGRGWCKKHYMNWYRHGDPAFVTPERTRATCTECGDPAIGRGLCRKHYLRWYKHGDPSVVLDRHRKRGPETCSECERPAVSFGYCTKHYRRFKVHGDPSVVGKAGNNGSQRKYSVNHDYFREIDTPEKAYWLGFITANGSVNEGPKSYCLTLELKRSDAGHLLKFAEAIGSDAPVRETGQNCSATRIHSWRLVESLVSLGVTARKSLVVEPPLARLAGLERYYWRGLWDGDGYISDRAARSRWHIGIVGSLACAEGFAAWARAACGSSAKLYNAGPNPRCWAWATGGTRMPQLLGDALRQAGPGFGLERKQIMLGKLCAIDFGEHEARLNDGRSAMMREAWVSGRHPRAS